ncbi:methyltransferase family protein [Methanococcus voltae]|uniref:Isoprenylcysteine carboxyl methyltransferase n=1 Tax=Methanococcus voltae (strain ATCC BAA-1334 / A3) TaxID=456320 RepID=D7DT29_METV3|nr:isoprenylcysteine carboxylmethyltransferase family protein [Methanococcus voltae]MCS3901935.1 protein-S-isoprenylcysteine O-methyltransferase Ste14 [Methanococcus voltae]
MAITDIKPDMLIKSILVIEILVSLIGELFNWATFYNSPYLIVFGIVIALLGYIMHVKCHKYHKKGHSKASEINKVVNTGIYGKVRHPMYTSILLIIWGIYLAWNFVYTSIVPVGATLLIFILAKKEEEYLSNNLGDEYLKYKKNVKWMFIPYLI